MAKRTDIGDVAIEYMRNEKLPGIGYENYGALDDVFDIACKRGLTRHIAHPMNRQLRVLNALARDARFLKYLIQCTNGRAEVLTRWFELKKPKTPSSPNA